MNHYLRSLFILLLFCMLISPLTGFSQSKSSLPSSASPIVLWPNGVPGEKGSIGEEKNMSKPSDKKVDGKAEEIS